eukprot:MONOS_5778.1-p1 / transcript=MONOS_5778.1 / gene=MONOS_5778 / organism=Monocercomonoides_exilis_PA203 / gene_product=unspecified product / transcript_product=unspecified product / location=Mono_scaffold00173:18544-20872(-) / protein_length=669 / sequence_SO=supercontig / SO=protein_coding / is_pseudo=false
MYIDDLPSYVSLLTSKNFSDIKKGIVFIRNLTLQSSNIPPSVIISFGILPQIISLLGCDNCFEIQNEVLWILTNLACGTREDIVDIMKSGFMNYIPRILASPFSVVREQLLWCLGNCAFEHHAARDYILSFPILPHIAQVIQKANAEDGELQYAMWCFSSLARNPRRQQHAEMKRNKKMKEGCGKLISDLSFSPQPSSFVSQLQSAGFESPSTPPTFSPSVFSGSPNSSHVNLSGSIFQQNASPFTPNSKQGLFSPQYDSSLNLSPFSASLFSFPGAPSSTSSPPESASEFQADPPEIEALINSIVSDLVPLAISSKSSVKYEIMCALANATEHNPTAVQLVISNSFFAAFVHHCASCELRIKTYLIKIAGNIAAYSLSAISTMIDAGILPVVREFLMNGSFSHQSDAAWLASIIAAGSVGHVDSLFSERIVSSIILKFPSSQPPLSHELGFVLLSVATASLRHAIALVDEGILLVLSSALEHTDKWTLLLTLTIIIQLLAAGERLAILMKSKQKDATFAKDITKIESGNANQNRGGREGGEEDDDDDEIVNEVALKLEECKGANTLRELRGSSFPAANQKIELIFRRFIKDDLTSEKEHSALLFLKDASDSAASSSMFGYDSSSLSKALHSISQPADPAHFAQAVGPLLSLQNPFLNFDLQNPSPFYF